MTHRYLIVRETQHGRSEYKAGRWIDQGKGKGHIYSSIKTAFRTHKKLIEGYPPYKDIVTIERV